MSMSNTKGPHIRCAVCHKPVDRMEWYDDRRSGKRLIRVACHGETTALELDLFRLESPVALRQDQLAVATAFEGKSIEGDGE